MISVQTQKAIEDALGGVVDIVGEFTWAGNAQGDAVKVTLTDPFDFAASDDERMLFVVQEDDGDLVVVADLTLAQGSQTLVDLLVASTPGKLIIAQPRSFTGSVPNATIFQVAKEQKQQAQEQIDATKKESGLAGFSKSVDDLGKSVESGIKLLALAGVGLLAVYVAIKIADRA